MSFFEFIVISIAVVLFPRAVGLQSTMLRSGVKMLRLVKWQGLQNARLGHVTLLYGSCMPRLDDSPAVKIVRLGLLAHLGTVVGVYFFYYKLFAVCPCVLSFVLSVGSCRQVLWLFSLRVHALLVRLHTWLCFCTIVMDLRLLWPVCFSVCHVTASSLSGAILRVVSCWLRPRRF